MADLVGVEEVLRPVVAGHRNVADDAPREHHRNGEDGGQHCEIEDERNNAIAPSGRLGRCVARDGEPSEEQQHDDHANRHLGERDPEARGRDQRDARRGQSERRSQRDLGDRTVPQTTGQQPCQREPRCEQRRCGESERRLAEQRQDGLERHDTSCEPPHCRGKSVRRSALLTLGGA